MLIVSGVILVLVTWVCAGLVVIGLGLLPSVLVARHHPSLPPMSQVVRMAIWWGLLLAAVVACLINLALPLHSVQAGLLVILVAVVSATLALLVVRRGSRYTGSRSWTRGSFILVSVLVLGVCYFALAALGPVTNYDSGLYHLGAVRYASDFPAIPGLANLYSALAYSNAEFPLAAILGNGPWQGDGFRLLNGFVMALAALDFIFRARSRKPSVGFYVLLSGLVVTWVPMLALSDYWVTSPSQDSSVFMITVVASAYIADAVTSKRFVAPAATAIALAVLLVLLRPTMVVFAVTVFAVSIIIILHRRHQGSSADLRWPVVAISVAIIAAAIAATLRDYVLSGWLQYPLSIFPFDVPWRAEDPSMYRDATLGFHRNPEDLWGSVEGWAWVVPWLTNRVQQWETYLWLLLAATATALLVSARLTRVSVRWRPLVLALAPSIAATCFWWVATPPSYRFAWGIMFTLATIPMGFALHALLNAARGTTSRVRLTPIWVFALAATPIAAVVLVSVIARFDWSEVTQERTWRLSNLGISVPYLVAPVVDVPVRVETTTSGLYLLVPTKSDQCWNNYPLCTPAPRTSLQLRGPDIEWGFLP